MTKPIAYGHLGGFRTVRSAMRGGFGVGAAAISAEAACQYDRPKLIAMSRQFWQDNGIYQGIITRGVNYVVGKGANLQAASSEKGWNDEAEGLWNEFWRNPTGGRMLTGNEVERQICSELFLCGDVGIILRKDGLIHVIEAEQIATRKNPSGVTRKKDGSVKFWHATAYSAKTGTLDYSSTKDIASEYFCFLCDASRPSQFRGWPPCQAMFPTLHRINDVFDSEAAAWQLLSRLALIRQQAENREAGLVSDSQQQPADDLDPIEIIDQAIIFNARPGEDIRGVDRNIPGQNFTESVLMYMRALGLPLGFPLEVLLMDWTKSNYSQSRAVMAQFQKTVSRWQRIIRDAGLAKIYRWKIDRWIAEGKLSDVEGKHRAEWIMETAPWLDQQKEAEAAGKSLDRGLVTQKAALAEKGLDREQVLNQREAEIRDAIARAKKIKEETGEAVPWQLFAGLEVKKDAVASAVPENNNHKSKSNSNTSDE